jgi:hypothetical protein
MADNIPVVTNTIISNYDIIRGNSCISYGDFVNNVNLHIKNGYQPYGKLVTVRDNGSNCTALYQVVVKYNTSNEH